MFFKMRSILVGLLLFAIIPSLMVLVLFICTLMVMLPITWVLGYL